MQEPFYVINSKTKREHGRRAHSGNIAAARAIADIIRTTLGPKSMLKMLLNPQGGIVLTNDGNAILREIDVCHPAAKAIITLSRTQDENIGDGTTSVIVLAAEMLKVSENLLEKSLHPIIICKAFNRVLEDSIRFTDNMTFPIDVNCRGKMLDVIKSCIGTKIIHRFGDLMATLALDAVNCVTTKLSSGHMDIDIKKYAKVEKIPVGGLEESRVLKGVLFNKDVINPGRMRRKIDFPRILLLDCPLEYKKGENMTNVELTNEEDFVNLLRMEEEWIRKTCEHLVSYQLDVVITEKGISDLATHYLQKAGISAIRRIRKTDNNRIARACGATIISRPDEIKESVIGTRAGLFEVQKIGDEFFSNILDCENPKACSIVLRCASKDVLNEVERNLMDAMSVARNVVLDPRLLPGGGATEMEISKQLIEKSHHIRGAERWPYRAASVAVEVIPRTLAQNCGVNIIRTLTKLRAKHSTDGGNTWGIDGCSGLVRDMKELKIWEPYAVKAQTIKTAIESACLLLRIDDIVSGISKREKGAASNKLESQRQEAS